MRNVANLLLVLITAALCVGLAEGATRLLKLAPPLERPDPEAGLRPLMVFDSTVENRYRPNAKTRIVSPYGEFDIAYETNDLGLRDRPLAAEKPPGERRLLVVGNSFVEGWGVDQSKTFLATAEKELNEAAAARGDIARWRFVDAGMSGFGAGQSFLLARQLLPPTKPDAIMLVLIGSMISADHRFLANAALDKDGIARGLAPSKLLAGSGNQPSADTGWETTPTAKWLSEHFHLARLVVQSAVNRKAQDRVTAGDPASDTLAAYRPKGDLGKLYEPTLRHVGALAALARQSGVPFLLLHLPMPFQLSDFEWSKGRQGFKLGSVSDDGGEQAHVAAFCATAQLSCLQATPHLRELAAKSASDDKLYFEYDFHLTTRGNRELGQWLGSELARSPALASR